MSARIGGVPTQPGITSEPGSPRTQGSLNRRYGKGKQKMARSRHYGRGYERKKALWMTNTNIGNKTFTSGVDGEALLNTVLPREGTIVRITGCLSILNNNAIEVAGLLLGKIGIHANPIGSTDYEKGMTNPSSIVSDSDDDWLLAQPYCVPGKRDNAPYVVYNFDQRAKRRYSEGQSLEVGMVQNSASAITGTGFEVALILRYLIIY